MNDLRITTVQADLVWENKLEDVRMDVIPKTLK